jgi:predicted DNA-binding transcriptional regulator YafY
MARETRLYELMQILRDGRLHRAADLAQRLGVSTRTVWRDMAALAESGLPVEGERGVGYILRAPLVLPPMVLATDELEALVAGLRGQFDGPQGRAARAVLAKLATLLPQAGIDPG